MGLIMPQIVEMPSRKEAVLRPHSRSTGKGRGVSSPWKASACNGMQPLPKHLLQKNILMPLPIAACTILPG